MKTKLVYIQWCDACSNNTAWLNHEEAIEWAKTHDWIVNQVGWILEETTEYILLAARTSEESEEFHSKVDGLIKIPTTWILKRVELKIP